jgi:hypothetical protein
LISEKKGERSVPTNKTWIFSSLSSRGSQCLTFSRQKRLSFLSAFLNPSFSLSKDLIIPFAG